MTDDKTYVIMKYATDVNFVEKLTYDDFTAQVKKLSVTNDTGLQQKK